MSPSENGGDTSVEKGGEPPVEFDFSNVRPEDFVCFGTIDENHSECQQCPFKVQCAGKAGVQLKE